MANGPPPAKRARFACDFEKTFEVLVGQKPNQKTYTLYHDPYAQRSHFFRSVLSPRWRTDPRKPVDLTDHTTTTFSAYMHCVLVGEVVFTNDDENEVPDWCEFFSLYALADKLGDHAAANLVIDEMIRRSDASRMIPRASDILAAYEQTRTGSPLRALIRDWQIYDVRALMPNDFEREEMPKELFTDVIYEYQALTNPKGRSAATAGIFGLSASEQMRKCQYHQHDDEHPKCP